MVLELAILKGTCVAIRRRAVLCGLLQQLRGAPRQDAPPLRLKALQLLGLYKFTTKLISVSAKQ